MIKTLWTLGVFSGLSAAGIVACSDTDKPVLTALADSRLALLNKEIEPKAKKTEEPAAGTSEDTKGAAEGDVKVVDDKPAFDLERAMTKGKEAYLICSACHQATGAGIPGAFPPIAKSNWVNSLSNDEFSKLILNGLQGEVEVNGTKYHGVMTPQKAIMDDQKIADVITYVKNSWGNEGGHVTVEEVKAARDATADQGMMKQEDFTTLK